ncbi:trypsin-like peptidase domain-containing protein [bacterium]|jgi:hypothetical protein|nr:trypsin-like peptidase domain-containing protein [bacterium]
MFCKNCGKEIKTIDTFCKNCGEEVKIKNFFIIKEITEWLKDNRIILFILIVVVIVMIFSSYPEDEKNSSIKNNELLQQNENIQSKSLSLIVSEWRPRIAYIYCRWEYDDGTTYLESQGSGLLGNDAIEGIIVLTNNHVIDDGEGYSPTVCGILFPDDPEVTYIYNEDGVIFYAADGDDWAYFKIKNPDNYINNNALPIDSCSDLSSNDAIGSPLVVIGYPSIGSQTDITATQGIISGIDGDYYITDAKIDHGNSGGAAILLKNNCYLGIPSAAVTGEIESMGRVLKAAEIFD